MPIIEVAISVPLNKTFDYLCDHAPEVGTRVKVPFGAKKVVGIVMSSKDKSEFNKLKSIIEVLDESPILDKPILDFLFWAAKYYHHPIGEVLLAAMPKNLRLGKEAKIKKLIGLPVKTSQPDFEITQEQDLAIKAILAEQHGYHGFCYMGLLAVEKLKFI